MASALVIAGTVLGGTSAASAATSQETCDLLETAVYQAVNPETGVNLFTTDKAEYEESIASDGFTDDFGVQFYVSDEPQTGLAAVHRLRGQAPDGDLVWLSSGTEIATAQRKYGYVDEGVAFYAPTGSLGGCADPILTADRWALHRQAINTERIEDLIGRGWTHSRARFFAVPAEEVPAEEVPAEEVPAEEVPAEEVPAEEEVPAAGGDGVFTFAVLPDTQTWDGARDPRFGQTTQWLVDNRQNLDLQYVAHTGDLTNWGWLVPSMYNVVGGAMDKLSAAGIPYSISVGNHDTRAVGWDGKSNYGGGAYQNNPECRERFAAEYCSSSVLVRETQELNQNFTAADFGAVSGVFEEGKIDNIWSEFSAEGKKWMVLSIEFAPRTEVVDWAAQVIADHPDTNVIISTHFYLDGGGAITPSNAGYGEQSGTYVFEHLVKPYSNVKMVFSGHTGRAAYRTDTTVGGTKVVSMMQNDVDATGNGVRIVTVDVNAGTLKSTIYVPNKGTYLTQYDKTETGMVFQ